jgi:hypothetical protein
MPFLLAASLAIACTPRDRAVRLERLAAQRRALDLSFERLEARFMTTQARVRFWEELRERHESVSAIACASQDEHAEEMAKRVLPPAPALHRARVAAVGPSRAPARVPAAVPAASGARGATVQARVRN